MELSSKQRADLERIADTFGLGLIMLFGSQAHGHVTPLSDVDLGVLPVAGRRLSTREHLQLIVAFQALFGRDDVDVVLLDSAGPLLRYEAFTRGRALLERDVNLRSVAHMRALRDYEDTKHFRAVQFQAMRDHLATGTFGLVV